MEIKKGQEILIVDIQKVYGEFEITYTNAIVIDVCYFGSLVQYEFLGKDKHRLVGSHDKKYFYEPKISFSDTATVFGYPEDKKKLTDMCIKKLKECVNKNLENLKLSLLNLERLEICQN